MSYILEALKKSQQERELGHVPTLETPTFLTEEEGTNSNLLILLAVILAALAVVIALYSVLRGGSPIAQQVEMDVQSAQMAIPEEIDQDQTTSMQPPNRPASLQPDAAESDPQPPLSSPQVGAPVEHETTDPSVVMEAPAVVEPPPRPVQEVPEAAERPVASESPQQGKVPPDLIADIEAFKREVRGRKSGTTDAAKSERSIAPEELRLPKDVRKRLPEFVMSAHIYDTSSSKRFVLINGLKTREGEESREEITVEQILPDGAVLSFDGHRFFQRR